mmetsp:Transcript_14875/g.25190  ORF Transcript_14875/g.25190 Transcript_14875/m.25190 type:complete len:295 (-) Transcript_14875:73-957(-)
MGYAASMSISSSICAALSRLNKGSRTQISAIAVRKVSTSLSYPWSASAFENSDSSLVSSYTSTWFANKRRLFCGVRISACMQLFTCSRSYENNCNGSYSDIFQDGFFAAVLCCCNAKRLFVSLQGCLMCFEVGRNPHFGFSSTHQVVPTVGASTADEATTLGSEVTLNCNMAMLSPGLVSMCCAFSRRFSGRDVHICSSSVFRNTSGRLISMALLMYRRPSSGTITQSVYLLHSDQASPPTPCWSAGASLRTRNMYSSNNGHFPTYRKHRFNAPSARYSQSVGCMTFTVRINST